ncbi:hypothetical protein GQ55_7G215300 [Panicum hallii var. hallii]|uniref:Uncharacterized protein n=1 Tax=Panicum hallii var. hallii TaxID=1504633 RepID=A0A2T7CXL1_9POAL|nr:hypothetical protein GQ55_7G215300 [Panicum hallii var. hallii]
MCAAELRIQLKLLIRCAGHREAQLELAIGDGAPRLPTVLDDGDDCGTRRCRAVVERRSRKGRIRRDPEISRGGRAGGAEASSPRRAAIAVTGAEGKRATASEKKAFLQIFRVFFEIIRIAVTNRGPNKGYICNYLDHNY